MGASQYIYLVFGTRECFKCKERIPVVAIGVPYNTDTMMACCDRANALALLPYVECCPAEIRKYLETSSGYRSARSRKTGRKGLMNTCLNCGAVQADVDPLEELSEPFRIDSPSDLEALKFEKVPVPSILGKPTACSSMDMVMLSYAESHHKEVRLNVVEPVIVSQGSVSDDAFRAAYGVKARAHSPFYASRANPSENKGTTNKSARFSDERNARTIFNVLTVVMALATLFPYLIGIIVMLPTDPAAAGTAFLELFRTESEASAVALMLLLIFLPGPVFVLLMRRWAMPRRYELFRDPPRPGLPIPTVAYTVVVLMLWVTCWEQLLIEHDYPATRAIVGALGAWGTAWLVAVPFAGVFAYSLFVRHKRG